MIVLNREVGESLRRDKYVNVQGGDFNLYGHFADFVRLTKSWENMEPDSYYGQAEAGMRYRRYSDFEYNPKTRELTQLEHRAYVQSKENNAYVGGLVRHFQDFSDEVISSPVMRSLIDTDFEVYKSVLPEELHDEIWQCQIHQIRIEIKPGKQLEITPEGIHCDGYPFSGVHFWDDKSGCRESSVRHPRASTGVDHLRGNSRHHLLPRPRHAPLRDTGAQHPHPCHGVSADSGDFLLAARDRFDIAANQITPIDGVECSTPVVLRRATAKDAQRMERFFRQFDEVSFCEWQDAKCLRGVLIQKTTTAYLAFDVAGEIVGAVLGGMLGSRGTINHLAVSPRYRSQGSVNDWLKPRRPT